MVDDFFPGGVAIFLSPRYVAKVRFLPWLVVLNSVHVTSHAGSLPRAMAYSDFIPRKRAHTSLGGSAIRTPE